MQSPAYPTKPPLSIGVIISTPYQLLDASGPMDILSMQTPEYLMACHAPPSLIAKSTPMTMHYISSTLDPIHASTGPQQLPTCTYETCPKLDYLLIPGPEPFKPFAPELIMFIKSRYEEVTAIWSVCSAAMIMVETGLIQGKNACMPKGLLLALYQMGKVPKGIRWQKKGRWVVDGKIWSSPAVHTGMDMLAEWCRGLEREVAEWGFLGSEFCPRAQFDDPYEFVCESVVLEEE